MFYGTLEFVLHQKLPEQGLSITVICSSTTKRAEVLSTLPTSTLHTLKLGLQARHSAVRDTLTAALWIPVTAEIWDYLVCLIRMTTEVMAKYIVTLIPLGSII